MRQWGGGEGTNLAQFPNTPIVLCGKYFFIQKTPWARVKVYMTIYSNFT